MKISERLSQTNQKAVIDIAVIRLPRISNFTDFDVFSQTDSMAVRYVSHPAQFGTPDMVIIPGTKSTIEDLLWMRQNGLEAMIVKAAKAGCIVLGFVAAIRCWEEPYGMNGEWKSQKIWNRKKFAEWNFCL